MHLSLKCVRMFRACVPQESELFMKTWIFNGNVITHDGLIRDGGVLVEDGKILSLLKGGEGIGDAEAEKIDAKGMYIAPGFIDVHVHGGGGAEVMGATPEEIVKIAEAHSRYGTTSILPTTLASPVKDLCEAMDAVKAAMEIPCGSNILGVHLEGPFLSPAQAGAQKPEYIYTANEENVHALLDRWNGVKLMGAAPECENGYWLGEELHKRGIVASVAHSDATFDEAIRALEHGYEDITHLYSGCSVMHRVNAYRIAGVVEAGLYEDRFTAQVIADGKHLPPALLKLICKCKGADRIILITDGLAMSASAIREGETYLQKNGVMTVMDDGVMKLMDRQAFAGSIATMSRLVRNMVQLAGVPIYEAVRMASENPAKLVRVSGNKGSLEVGKDADIVLFDEHIDVKLTMTGGRVVYREEAV